MFKRLSMFVALVALVSCSLGSPAFSESMDDPMPQDIQNEIGKVLVGWKNAPFLKQTIEIPGWPIYNGSDWYFQYPPDWQVIAGNPYYFLVTDRRHLAVFSFVQVQNLQGLPTIEQIRDMIFQQMIVSNAGNVPSRIFAMEEKNSMAQTRIAFNDDTGLSKIWFFRWLHPQSGRMIGSIQVSILARGISTSCQWVFSTCPENEFLSLGKSAFGPMMISSHFTVPKGGSDPVSPPDADDDGVPDDEDPDPNDPNVK